MQKYIEKAILPSCNLSKNPFSRTFAPTGH
jgi:hypothetical protein